MPIEWNYYPSASLGPQPSKWLVWINTTAFSGFITVYR